MTKGKVNINGTANKKGSRENKEFKRSMKV